MKNLVWQEGENSRTSEEEYALVEQEKVFKEQMICAKNLYDKIQMRCDELRDKCGISLDNLCDYQVLGLNKKYRYISF